jgi:hypothetical protein
VKEADVRLRSRHKVCQAILKVFAKGIGVELFDASGRRRGADFGFSIQGHEYGRKRESHFERRQAGRQIEEHRNRVRPTVDG